MIRSDLLPVFATAMVLISARILFAYYNHRRRAQNATSLYPTFESERDKISPPGLSPEQILGARKPTNERLERVFGFHSSAFVTSDKSVHDQFVRCAKALLENRDWTRLRDVASDAAVRYAINGREGRKYDDYIQAVTLATIVVVLFSTDLKQIDVTHLKFDDLVLVARGITHLWSHSKASLDPMPDKLAQVNRILLDWIRPSGSEVLESSRDAPDWCIGVDENPLEFVVPAFETLWRVVAVGVAHAHGREEWSALFVDLSDTSLITSKSFAESNGFVLEVLRLYPPTRRIERTWDGRSVKADVELMQQSPIAWGDNASTFDPTRENLKLSNLLAFGARPLACPGAYWAPQAVAVIIAGVLRSHIGLVRGDTLGSGREGWHGWSIVNPASES